MKRPPARTISIILGTVCASLLLVALGIAAFLYSGVYDMAAVHPHSKLVRPLLLTLKRNAVQYHARDLVVPDLARPELVERGFTLYRQNCVTCHGAPGEARSPVGRGINPIPPPLEKAAQQWTPAEIAWIVRNGLKMAGMPGYALGEQPGDLWAMTAFVMRLNTLSPEEYRDMLAASQGELEREEVQWLASDPRWDALEDLGDIERGRVLAEAYGCGACHAIPGVPGANSQVGPPLTDWAKRHYIAGRRVNTPANLVPWLVDPKAIEPGTLMPDVGLSEEEAWDIARYLYSLGRDESSGRPQPIGE